MNEHDQQQRSSAPPQCEGCGTTREDRHLPDCLIDNAIKMGITPDELEKRREQSKNSQRRAAGIPPLPTVIDDVTPGGIVVGPDDVLVVTLPVDTDLDVLSSFTASIRGRLGDRVIVICGAEELAVLKAGGEQ